MTDGTNTTKYGPKGMTINPGANEISLTDEGLNNGGKVISNVASGGTVETNAANIGDVKKAAAASKTTVSVNKKDTETPNLVLEETVDPTDGHTNSISNWLIKLTWVMVILFLTVLMVASRLKAILHPKVL